MCIRDSLETLDERADGVLAAAQLPIGHGERVIRGERCGGELDQLLGDPERCLAVPLVAQLSLIHI